MAAISKRVKANGGLVDRARNYPLGDALAVRALLDGPRPPRAAVIVGGGYVGLEMAEALHTRGLATTIVASGTGLLGGALLHLETFARERGLRLVERGQNALPPGLALPGRLIDRLIEPAVVLDPPVPE
mgnify:CR=1 FL=1